MKWYFILAIAVGCMLFLILISSIFYRVFFKRFWDIFFSGLGLIILLPLLLLVGLLVRIKLGKPIMFKQTRPGKNGELFQMHKFRSMLPSQTKDGRILSDEERLECLKNGIDILSDEERLTKFGKIIRALSLDELPELWNIFKGDMSFVGPRPLATIYLPFYTKEEFHRHDVRPGLTGLAQVNGRNSILWKEKFEFDLKYVKSYSFFGDLAIIIKTFLVVFKRKNIGQGTETPESFNISRQKEWNNGTVVRDR